MAMAMVVAVEYLCPSGRQCIILHMENKNVDNAVDSAKDEKADAVEKEEQAVDVAPAPVEAVVKNTPPAVAPAPASAYAVVGNGETDDVILSRCVFKNKYAKKSLTVHHVQRRLAELGYNDAASDKDGWYGDLTKKAVLEFQEYLGIEGDGMMNAETFAAIFDGDKNVTVIID